jgi:hypothetical protein
VVLETREDMVERGASVVHQIAGVQAHLDRHRFLDDETRYDERRVPVVESDP